MAGTATVKSIDLGQDWGVPLGDIPEYGDIKPWRLAVVLDVTDASIRIGLQPEHDKSGALVAERETGTVTADGVQMDRPAAASSSSSRATSSMSSRSPASAGEYRLRQIPEVSGACVAMDPFTGRVLAMVGGFSYDQSEFNRATQAQRQPGSSFKPFVYAAALDNGYTPSSIVLDEPIEIDQGNGEIWTPENFEGKSGGPHTLRFGIEHSINQMTVRLARDIGMPLIVEYAKRFGVYDNLPPFLSMSLGAGETTVLRMITGYSMFANGGKRIKATLIDRIQDRWGNTIYRHDERICQGCDARQMGQSGRAEAGRQARAGDRSADRLSDHLDHGRRHPARHRHRDQGSRQASRRQDRHDQRRQGSLVRRLFARPRLRRLHGLRQAALARRQRAGRALHRADFPRFHEDGARRTCPTRRSACRRASS